MRKIIYNRAAASAYARRWALSRNPAFLDFDGLGGDCTNFVSQCVYAGCGVMNYSPRGGWFYISPASRSPSWTGVEPFYAFITCNTGAGPYGVPVSGLEAGPGDIVQLGGVDGPFYHTLFILYVSGGETYVAAHTYDALERPLSSYRYARARFAHILGARAPGPP